MKRITKHCMLIFMILFLICNSVLAMPSYEQVQKQKESVQANKDKLKVIKDKTFKIEQNIESLDNQIESLMINIQENNQQMSKIQEQIKLTQKQLTQSENNMKKQNELYKNRIKAMYINGIGGYLEVLFDSQSFSDFISRIELIESIIEIDKKIILDIKLKQEQLNENKEKLNRENEKLVVLNTENNKKMDKFKIYKNQQSKLIKRVKNEEKLYASIIGEEQTKLNQILLQIQNMSNNQPQRIVSQNTVQQRTISRGDMQTSNKNVINYAFKFLGIPYKWGGTTPSGFDCSGFTQYVYRQFGVNLGRTTYAQINNGYSISRNQIKEGDLVFFGKGSPTHVGIYIGNGMYIHSPRTGDVIKVSSFNRSDYIGARRVK